MKLKKSGKIFLISAIALILIIGTAAFILSQAAAATVAANVEFEPRKVDLGAPAPKEFNVYVWFTGKYADYVNNIDTRTILVEGLLQPKGGWKHTTIVNGKLLFQVDGPALVDLVIWPKIWHMGIVEPNPNKPYKIPITVTGQFLDGNLFEGSFDMRVLIPSNPGPPPPPPV